ncbi:MAG TPA: TIM barrel protein [Chloroflexota bacterium]|nr:TIM barrel protein [Chloroflexota bacterium]
MQGRLSPPEDGRLQSFPVRTWRQEFALAREAGLSCIEWIYEERTAAFNPLSSTTGFADIQRLAHDSQVQVWSVCADCYMEQPLISQAGILDAARCSHLRWLMGQAAKLGCNYIVLPFVDSARLAQARHREALELLLEGTLAHADSLNLELHLETDLEPDELATILRRFNHPRLRANLDLGNSASLGHDPTLEVEAIMPWLGSVHVKDRLRGGGTVPLGEGDADLSTYFRLLMERRYRGTFILQVARSAAESELEWCRRNRDLVASLMSRWTLAQSN